MGASFRGGAIIAGLTSLTHAASGSRMLTVAPTTGLFRTAMLPPWPSISARQIARPKPNPGGAGRARRAPAIEALEEPRRFVVGNSRAGVRDGDHGGGILDGHADLHAAVRGRELESVVDHVREHEPRRGRRDPDDEVARRVRRYHDVAPARLCAEAPDRPVEHRHEWDGLANGLALTRVEPGEDQQLLGQPREALDLAETGAQRLVVLLARSRPAQRDLELGAQPGERRAQLVRRVGG